MYGTEAANGVVQIITKKGGGGAPHLAYGGGRDASKIPEAVASVPGWLKEKLK